MKYETQAIYGIRIFSCAWLKPIDIMRSLLRIVLIVALQSALFKGPKDQGLLLGLTTLSE
jgi:hypothetical protein